jgi:hypothetical protein
MNSHMNIGVRNIMPVFPLFAVMGAAAISRLWSFNIRPSGSTDPFAAPPLAKRRASGSPSDSFPGLRGYAAVRTILQFVPVAILLWATVLVVITYPNYLTYFSPHAGGTSNGWKLLSDSNAETGQEVKNLADFLKKHGETKINGLFMGSGYIEFYGIEECDLPCKPDEENDEQDSDHANEQDEVDQSPDPEDRPPAYVAIGAWYLQEVDVTPEQKAAIDPYRSMKPEAVVGNSIFVFRANDQPHGMIER